MRKKQNTIHTAMKISVIEGIFAQINSTLTGIGSAFITKAAVILNATPIQFSLLAGISQLSQFFQLYAVYHNRNIESRKKPCVWFAFWGRLCCILLGASFVIAKPNLAIWFFLSILFVSNVLQTISGNMWIAWMSDLIPKKMRGRFFSLRMQIHLLFGLAIGYLFSFITDLFETTQDSWKYELIDKLQLQNIFQPQNISIALSAIFVIGTALGIFGLTLLNKQPERNKKNDTETTTASFDLFEPLRNKDFRRLLGFGMWWMFAIGVGSAFWGPFMIQKLKMSLVEMQLCSMLSAAGMLVSYRFWGKFIDTFGNKTAMKICVVLGAINPLMWLLMSEDGYALIYIESITSGIMWSGANLIAFNFVLAIAPKRKEQHWAAIYSATGGTMMLTSILLCGIFFPKQAIMIRNTTIHPEQILFAITGILRLTAGIPLHFVNEKKAVGLRKTIGYASDYVLMKLRIKN